MPRIDPHHEITTNDSGRQVRGRMRTLFHVATGMVLAWGAFAFGAVYSWAFWPLAVASSACGLAGLMMRAGPGVQTAARHSDDSPRVSSGSHAWRWHRSRRPADLGSITSAPLLWCLVTVAAAILLQLAPISVDLLMVVSPRSAAILSQLDVPFATHLVSHRALSIAPAATTTAFALYLAFAVMMLGVARVASLGGPRLIAALICAIGVAVALAGIIQKPLYAGRIYGVWTPLMGGTPFGPFVNPNHFAGWMLMALPIAFGSLCAAVARAVPAAAPGWRDRIIWFSSRDASETVLLAAAAVVMAVSLVLTMSRSGMIAFAVSVAVTSWFAIRRLPVGSKRMLVAVYLAGVVVLAVGCVGGDTISARLGSANAATINERLPIWRDTWHIVRDFWLTGTGLNTYGVATLFYQTAMPEYHLREAHNDYLQLAAEGGLLLSIPVACAIAAFARQVRQRFRFSQGSSYWIRLGAVTGLIAIALQSTVDFSLQMPGNAALFAALCGIALHRPPAARADREPEDGPDTCAAAPTDCVAAFGWDDGKVPGITELPGSCEQRWRRRRS